MRNVEIMEKIWTFIKCYYKPILVVLGILIIGIITFSIFRNSSKLKDVLNAAKDSYDEQIKILENVKVEKLENEKKLKDLYESNKKVIEEEYKKENLKLNKENHKELKKLVHFYNENPEKLTEEISKEFGIENVGRLKDEKNK